MHSPLFILFSGINTTPDTDGDNSPDDLDIDDDNDGFTDVLDAFPTDPHEWLDTDGDGTGNNSDLDDDNDGVPDEFDAFPLDPTRSEAPDEDNLMDLMIPIFKAFRDRQQVQ